MKNNYPLAPALLLAAFLPTGANAQAPVIKSITPVSTTVEQYDKFEAKLELSASWSNPYDYDNIRVEAVFTAPNGQQKTVDGFFMQEYNITNTQTGAISPVGSGVFKIRFAPDQIGAWQYAVSCTSAAGTGVFAAQNFDCVAVLSNTNKGFVRANQTNFLNFDNGEQYIPVGENMAWQQNNIYQNYTAWLDKLSDNGGNFIRLWLCHWGIGLEWKKGVNGFDGLRRYHQNAAFYLDWLLDRCAEKDVYVMLCLNHHGQVSSQVNPNWNESPYNTANGGMCANTWDFFTNATAKSTLKNRLRYVLARWGYQRSIMAWELFNEVDWTDQFEQRKADVAAWHVEMAGFLKQKDVQNHLVTTSYAQDPYDAEVWNHPDIDLSQTHYYIDAANMERALVQGCRNYLDAFGKPTLNGEFGISTGGAGLSSTDPAGIHIHNALWASLFGGGLGAGASWWWDSYIDPQNLYTHFAAVSALAGKLPLHALDFRPTAASVSGAPADLSLTPSLGWGALADSSFTIGADGALTPANAKLSQFLYGAQWNTQYRRPPVFKASFPAAGKFSVKTGGSAGQSPKITIWLDGVQKLSQNAAVNQSYAIDVPAGQHTIKVDNTGTDWISIASYNLPGIGSAADVYVLKSSDNQRIAGWILHNQYNHVQVKANGEPTALQGAEILVGGMENGIYTAKFYDCLGGALLGAAPVTVNNGTLKLPAPELLWDLAFVVDALPVNVAEAAHALPVDVYPNPARAGSNVQMAFQTDTGTDMQADLLDAAGKPVAVLFSGVLPAGEQRITGDLRADLPAGVYWLRVRAGEQLGVKALGIVR